MTQEQFETAGNIKVILMALGVIKKAINNRQDSVIISLDTLGDILLPYIEKEIQRYQTQFDEL